MKTLIAWIKKWKLLSLRTVVVLGFLAYTIIGFMIVPRVIKSQIEKQSLTVLGRQARVDRVLCNPFTLSLTLEGFSIPDRPGSNLIAFDSLFANAQLSSIFHWALTLKDLQIERPYFSVRRFSDGKINILEVMEKLRESTQDTEDRGLPRAIFQTISINQGHILIDDKHRKDPLEWNWSPVHFTLHDISTIPEKRGANDGTIGLQGGGRINVSGSVIVEPLSLDGSIIIEGAFLDNVWEAAAEYFDFELTHGVLDTELRYELSLHDDGVHIDVTDLKATVSDVGFSTVDTDVDLMKVDLLTVDGVSASWPERVVHGKSIVISGASVFAWMEPDGTRAWDLLVPQETQAQLEETYQTLEEKLDLSASLDRFELIDGEAIYEDRTHDPLVRFAATGTNLVVNNISTDDSSTWPFEVTSNFLSRAKASAEGTFGASPLSLDAAVGMTGLDLAIFQPYLALLAPVELTAGVLSADGKVAASSTDKGLTVSYQGSMSITGVDLNETLTGDNLIGWGDLTADGIDAQLQPLAVDIASVGIDGAGLEINIAPDGTINLLEFLNALGEGSGTSANESDPWKFPRTSVGRLQLENCYGQFTDSTIDEPFVMKLATVEGTISGITTDSAAGAKVKLEASIETGGLIRVDGTIDPFDYARLTDLDIDLRNVDLQGLSPMAIKFIGHPMTLGEASLDLDYDVENGALTGANHIEAHDLELGDKVEGQGMFDLPFKLGVSLLKDKQGRIILDIPLEGDLNDGGFGIGTAIESAVDSVMSELVKSPFKLLSKIGGSGDEDLEHIEFAAGRSKLGDHAKSNLEVLAIAMRERPTLHLQIEGAVDQDADAAALRYFTLEEMLLENGANEDQLHTGVQLEIVESVFQAHFSAADLHALRKPFASAEGQTAENPPGSASIDEPAYRQALRQALLADVTVDPAHLQALGPQRAQAIRQFLVDHAGLGGNRVTVSSETTTLHNSGSWVVCLLTIEPE